jgi:hypothetical protein
MSDKPSNWQKSIEGEWHGMPSIFEPDGTHVGWNKVYRQSANIDGKTLYTMNTKLDATGELRSRMEFADFAFGVIDSDNDRIYLGPDFIGSGQPFGALVDATYYSPAWTGELRTMVHIVNGDLQVYSSLIYDGPTIYCVFNGLYQVAFDYHENEETRKRIDAFVESERKNGNKQYQLDAKRAGFFTGEMEVYDHNQQKVGTNKVTIHYKPLTLLRAEQIVEIEGVINRKYTYTRYRNGNKQTFEGPQVFGNSIGYGRALYTTQHIHGEAVKIRGREFQIDDDFTMSAVWEFHKSNKLQYMTFGVLKWQATEDVLTPNLGK